MSRIADHHQSNRSTRLTVDRLAQPTDSYRSQVDELRRSLSILHVCAAHGIELTPQGRAPEYRGRCPFPEHRDDEPSFIVTPRGNRWRCTRCGRGGGLLGLLMRLDHLTRAQAVDRLLVHPGLIDRATRLRQEATPRRARSPEGGRPCRA